MAKERTAKVVIVGDNNVGKTSLLLRFVDNKFPLYPVTTIGRDFKKRPLDVGNVVVNMEIWDTAGQERYKSLTSRFFRGSNGVILVYDVTNMKSFLGIQNWINELDYHGVSRCSCLLVGNKIDLSHERAVDNTLASNFAHRHGLHYLETSVKEDVNVQTAFAILAKEMVEQMKGLGNSTEVPSNGIVQLPEKQRRKGHRCKCS